MENICPKISMKLIHFISGFFWPRLFIKFRAHHCEKNHHKPFTSGLRRTLTGPLIILRWSIFFEKSQMLICATLSSRNSTCFVISFLKLEDLVSDRVEYFIHISALFMLSKARGYSFKAFKHLAFRSNNLYIRLLG